MPVLDPTRVYDGWSDLSGGVDGGRSPDLIDLTQCAESENVVYRGGVPTTRPGFRDLEHEFDDEHRFTPEGQFDPFGDTEPGPPNPSSIGSEEAFKTKVFQGASYFAPPHQPASIMASIGGRLFQIIPKTNGTVLITEFVPENQTARRGFQQQRNSETHPLAYMVQADRFHVTQDGESRAIIFDGVKARRAEDNEVPTGTIMAYGMGRLVVNREQDIYFGDLLGSHDLTTAGESVLRFTETTFLNEGFPASISSRWRKKPG